MSLPFAVTPIGLAAPAARGVAILLLVAIVTGLGHGLAVHLEATPLGDHHSLPAHSSDEPECSYCASGGSTFPSSGRATLAVPDSQVSSRPALGVTVLPSRSLHPRRSPRAPPFRFS